MHVHLFIDAGASICRYIYVQKPSKSLFVHEKVVKKLTFHKKIVKITFVCTKVVNMTTLIGPKWAHKQLILILTKDFEV